MSPKIRKTILRLFSALTEKTTTTKKLISLSLLYFENAEQVVIMEFMLFFRNMRKKEGEAAERHWDNSRTIPMLVCFFVCFFLSLFVRFSYSSPFMAITLIWMKYRITLPVCLCCICLFNVHLRISAPVERNIKGS